MKAKNILWVVVFIISSNTSIFGQNDNQTNEYNRHFIGSSMLMLINLMPNPPDYYQINYGYRFTAKDAVLVDIVTWKLNSPKGIPYSESVDTPEEKFPGYLRESGIDIAYQRILYKGLNASLHINPLIQNYLNQNNKKIQTGFQLFTSIRFGYQFNLFQHRFFIEPTIAFNYWPITTNRPESFKTIEDPWPNRLFFDPNIHFGINF